MASLTHTHYTPHDKNGFIKLFIALRFFSVPSFHTRTKVQFLNKMRLLMKTFKITYLNFLGKNEAFLKELKPGSCHFGIIFTCAIISQINCQLSRKGLISKFCSKPKNKLKLNVFNVNVWGLSYFDDLPIPSTSEPFDVDSVRQTLTGVNSFIFLNKEISSKLL